MWDSPEETACLILDALARRVAGSYLSSAEIGHTIVAACCRPCAGRFAQIDFDTHAVYIHVKWRTHSVRANRE